MPSCSECRFFESLPGGKGHCKRNAPVPHEYSEDKRPSYWPLVDGDDESCGEFKVIPGA